ncbi:MAG: response regulator transcription factor [Thiobacillus sp.]
MKTLLADDHPLMREGVRQVLSQLEPPVDILDAHDYPSLFAQTAAHADLDLAVVDLNMPGFSGVQGIVEFRGRFPDVPLVVLSASESPRDIRGALEAGALGYIPKAMSSTAMLDALRRVLAGDVYVPPCLGNAYDAGLADASGPLGLTARQADVARLLVLGHTNRTIADQLKITEATVKVHMRVVFEAVNARNRTEAVIALQQSELG